MEHKTRGVDLLRTTLQYLDFLSSSVTGHKWSKPEGNGSRLVTLANVFILRMIYMCLSFECLFNWSNRIDCKWHRICWCIIWTPDVWLWTIKQSKSFLCGQAGPLHHDRAAHLKCSSSQLAEPVQFWLRSKYWIKHVVLIECMANGKVLWSWPPMRKFLKWSQSRSLGLVWWVILINDVCSIFAYMLKDVPIILWADQW